MSKHASAPPATTGRGAGTEHGQALVEHYSTPLATDTLSIHDAIAAVRAGGRNRDIRCPAHDDRRESLSVGRGDDGRILLRCHAGCETEAVLQAAGLDWPDVMPPRTNGSGRVQQARIVAAYNYRDEVGQLLYQGVRVLLTLRDDDSPSGEGREGESTETKSTTSTRLVEIAQELYRFEVSTTGEPFAIPQSGPKVVATLRGSRMSLRVKLAREHFKRTRRAPSQQVLADALAVIEGSAP